MSPPAQVQPQTSADKKKGVMGVISEGFEADGPGGLNEVVVREFYEALGRSDETAMAVAAIRALTTVIRLSTATTLMGLSDELRAAAAALQRVKPTDISLKAGCELFLRYTTRSGLEAGDMERAKARLIERGIQFADTSTGARKTIAQLGARFITANSVILTHGYSRVVRDLLKAAARMNVRFSVLVTEGRPDATGLRMCKALSDEGIPATLILDAGVAGAMEKVDMVLVGAEAIVENGGIVNKLGTYGIAICAKAHNKQFYVAAESYKFSRLYPISQRDLPEERNACDLGPLLPPKVTLDNPSRDYTPPNYINLLVTDLGVLTPAGVSDELIQLYV